MGTTSSSPETQLSQAQQDIKYLGDRMPFGDSELWHIYKAYNEHLEHSNAHEQGSFLVDFGALCLSNDTVEKIREQKLILQVIEEKILPSNFGNTLYQTSFLRPQDISMYNESNMGEVVKEMDDFTRVANLERFFDGVSNSTRRGTKKTLNVLFQVCQQHKTDEEARIDPMEFIEIGYRVALASAFLSATQSNDDVARYIPNKLLSKDHDLIALGKSLRTFATKRKQRMAKPSSDLVTLVSFIDVLEWAEQTAPMFAAPLASLMHQIFLPSQPQPPTRSLFEFPILSDESTIFENPSSPLLFSFGCMTPALSGEFYRLYTSASDGLSFNRLQNALLGYGGPTLFIIRSVNNSVFGAYTSSAWKESKDFYGNTDCFLYQLLPTTAVYRPSGNSQNFMYCNSFARSRGYDKQKHGIGFGGTVQEPRLFISESFDDCLAGSADLTFERGHLLSNHDDKTFEIDSLEVWGVGGTDVVMEALGARARQRDIRQAAINKARKVDKAAFLEDFQSGLFDSKAFAHRAQIQGRDGACVGEEDLRQYNRHENEKRNY